MATGRFPAQINANLTGVRVSHEKNNPGIQGIEQRVLLLGQQTSTGTIADDIITPVTSAAEVYELAGAGSELAIMASIAESNGAGIPLSVAAISAASGAVAATGTIAITGTATEAGEVAVAINGTRSTIAVSADDNADTVATALNAEIGDNLALPVRATVSAGTITLTVQWAGITGNDITVVVNPSSADSVPAGLTINTTNTTGGTGTPSVEDMIDNIVDSNVFTVIAHPYTDSANLTLIEDLEDTRWSPQENKPFVAITASHGTATEVIAIASARNSFVSMILGTQDVPQTEAEVASAVGAQIAVGWSDNPARQFYTKELIGIDAPDAEDQWSYSVRNNALPQGVSTLRVQNNIVQIGQLRNTYTTTEAGTPAPIDDRLINTVITVASIIYDLDTYFETNYADALLKDDDGEPLPQLQKVVTPVIMRSLILSRYGIYVANGWCENPDAFAESVVVVRSTDNPNRLDTTMQVIIIGNLRVNAMTLQFGFNR